MSNHSPIHFKGKEAIEHVIEAQAQGIIDSTEIHGTEIPGHLSAGADAAKETAIAALLIWITFSRLNIAPNQAYFALGMIAVGWLAWKTGRSAWLGWSRLERLHRIVDQERWEIEHNRSQERSELKALYHAKGFEGKLLDDVVDTLMSDNDRLLKVMVEEELGLKLEVHEHPLKQGLGAFLGAIAAFSLCGLALMMSPSYGLFFGAGLAIALSSMLSAKQEQNNAISAVVWNLGIAALSCGLTYFLLQYLPDHS